MSMLDHLTAAATYSPVLASWQKPLSRWDIAADYFRTHRNALCPAFDLWLVKVGDELAKQAGTPESRFCERVCHMVGGAT